MILETTLAMSALSSAASVSKSANQILQPAVAPNAISQLQPILPCLDGEGESDGANWPPG